MNNSSEQGNASQITQGQLQNESKLGQGRSNVRLSRGHTTSWFSCLFDKMMDLWIPYIAIMHGGDRYINTFPNKPLFLRVCRTNLLKTLWEKEKLLIKSNFSISHSVFTLLENFPSFSSNLKLLSANSFSLEESKICCLGKG